MKLQFKAIVRTKDGHSIAKNGTTYQNFTVFIPARVNEFGEKTGKDQVYPITAFNDKAKLLSEIKSGDKIEIVAYLNSREWVNQQGGLEHGLTINLFGITKL